MLGIYVREGSPSTEGWVCSVIGGHHIYGLLMEELAMWCLQGKETREVRVQHRLERFIQTTDEEDTRQDADSLRNELAEAAAATGILDINPCENLCAPCWISDSRENQIFVQHVMVRTRVPTMAGLPDVEAYLAHMDDLDAHADELLALANRPPLPVSDKPAAVLRALAESEPLAHGLVIACETDESKIALRLDSMLEDDIFAARADICGTGLLQAGDRLYRTVNGPSGETWSAEIAEVAKVLSHDTGGRNWDAPCC